MTDPSSRSGERSVHCVIVGAAASQRDEPIHRKFPWGRRHSPNWRLMKLPPLVHCGRDVFRRSWLFKTTGLCICKSSVVVERDHIRDRQKAALKDREVILPLLLRRSPLGMPTFTRGLIRGGQLHRNRCTDSIGRGVHKPSESAPN